MNNYLNSQSIFLKTFLLLSVLTLAGCQQDKADLAAYVQQVKASPAPDIEPLPKIKPYEKFVYSVGDLRNPFTKTVLEPEVAEDTPVTDNGIHPDQNRLKEALEEYPLASLQFVGTLSKEKPWALIRSSDGVIHRVQAGNYMGQNHGKILSVSDTEIILKEIVAEPTGGFIERDSTLSLVDLK